MNTEYKSHPSYGVIELSKPSAGGRGRMEGGRLLFGSKVRHASFVHLTIHGAQILEDGVHESIMAKGTIIKVAMSEAQWAHMVSSFGQAEGTPVTIVSREGSGFIEDPPEPVQVIDLANKSADDMKDDLVVKLRALESDVKTLSTKSGTVTKKDLVQMARDFNTLSSWLDSNFDFLANQVKERMEKEVAKANIEIEAIISNAVTRLGHRALGERLAAGSVDVQELLGGGE